ncbi:uncharacterized protein LOC123013813 isoform X2 [Tribolium madens]|nr:uncharacterized protein LOC123013813 isoform X2 [Tribolium madens]
MDYTKRKLMKDDYFKILKFMASGVFQSKVVKSILICVFLTHTVISLLTIYYVLYVIETKLFINYASVFFAEFYPMLAIVTLIFKSKMMENLKNEIKMWSIDNASEDLQSEIKLKIKITTRFVIINSLIAVIAGFLYVQQLSDDVNLFFAYRFIRDNFPHHNKTLEFLYRMTYPIISYLMTVHAYQCIYFTQHVNYQLKMFKEVITELTKCETFSSFENRLIFDKKYQTEIERKLKFCIRRSQEFINIYLTKNKEIGSLIAGFAICGLFLGIGITLYLSTGKFTSEYYLRMSVTSIAGIVTFSTLIWSGQTVETMISDLVMTFNKISWYNFNQSNKKLYLIFLINMMRDRKIKFTENYSINYQLGLAIVRGIYSFVSVVASKLHH